MDAEFLQLAQEAVTALQLQGPSWVEHRPAWSRLAGLGLVISGGGSRGDPGGIEADGGSRQAPGPGN